MNERAHVEYFDWLRIIAALSVIFMHTAAGPLRAGINTGWHLLNVCTSLAFTAVPLFFMMSGYLLMTSRKTADISVLLRHRLPRLVVPLAGWTVVAVLWQLFLAHTLTPGAIRVQLVAALNGPVMVHFWYLYTLIALYVLSPILYGGIRTLGKSGRVYLFVLAAAVSVHTVLLTVLPDGAAQYVDLDIFGKLKIFGGHMATFVLGYLLGSYEKKIPNWLLVLGAAGTLAVISVGTWLLTVRTGEFNQNFQNQSSGFEIVLAACIFLLCKQTCNRPPRAWVRAALGSVVSLSMAIYLMHNIFLSMLYSVGVSPRSFGGTVGVTLAGVCRVLCCDENGGDRQASVLPCHRQNVCRGVPQLQLGIYLPQAARMHRDENIKTAGRRKFLRPAVCVFTFPRGAAPRARPRRRCSPVRS